MTCFGICFRFGCCWFHPFCFSRIGHSTLEADASRRWTCRSAPTATQGADHSLSKLGRPRKACIRDKLASSSTLFKPTRSKSSLHDIKFNEFLPNGHIREPASASALRNTVRDGLLGRSDGGLLRAIPACGPACVAGSVINGKTLISTHRPNVSRWQHCWTCYVCAKRPGGLKYIPTCRPGIQPQRRGLTTELQK